jgi:hypothetical protein
MSQRDEIHRKALRAALAVTGRAHTGLAPALGAALVTAAACSAPQPAADPDPVGAPATTNSSTDDAPAETAAATDEVAPDPTSCVVEGTARVDRDCCFAYGLEPAGCTTCQESTVEEPCLSCVADQPGGDPACCDYFYKNRTMDEAYSAGCMPWGPPAPPAFAGLTLDDLLPPAQAA